MKKSEWKNLLKFYYKFMTIVAIALLLFFLLYFFLPTYTCQANVGNETLLVWQIEQTAQNVSRSHEYIQNKFDCTEFSQELVKQLQKQNISAYCVWGMYEDEDGIVSHLWVESLINNQTIPVEATGGFIIPQQIYKKYYTILKKGICF